MSIFKKFLGKGIGKGKDGSAFGAFSRNYVMTDIVLGSGSYAEVRKARKKKTNQVVAVKIIDKTGLSQRELKGLSKEVNILKSLRHKNVVQFYDSFEEEDVMYVVMEYVGGGELFHRIVSDDQDFTEEDARKIIHTLAEALQHCKEKGVIHRDIKPQNLLLTTEEEGGELKLADFNLSIQIDPDSVNFSILQTMCGTPNYVAPEILSQKPYDYKCDIWSLGVISYLLLSGGYLPFFVEEEGEEGKDLLLQKVRRGRWNFYPPEAWQNVSNEAKDFLLHVMERNPEKRYDYETLLNHPWLKANKNFGRKAINVKDFKQSHYKRQMLCASAVKEAVKNFRDLMSDGVGEEEKRERLEFEKQNLAMGASGESGFGLLDE